MPAPCLTWPCTCTCTVSCLQEQDPERRAAMHAMQDGRMRLAVRVRRNAFGDSVAADRLFAIRDTRVDVCLYFIPPHRLRKVG